jgi:hypothetical protein
VPIIEDSPYYYYNPCERAEIEFPDNGTITLVPELWFGSEHMPGEWLIENFYINDRAGRWNNYSYRPDISETHYVRSYDRYDNNTHWSWVEEESTLLLLKFNVTGDSPPEPEPEPTPDPTGPINDQIDDAVDEELIETIRSIQIQLNYQE